MRRAVLTLVLSAVATVNVAPQAPQSPASVQVVTLHGRVLDDETADPLRNVRVTATSDQLGNLVVLTDTEGRFDLPIHPQSRVRATKTGYSSRDIPTGNGQEVAVRLERGAVIAGRVVDEVGQPIIDGRVVIESTPGSAATVRLVTTTDDRGDYRIAGIPRGSFTVAVARFQFILPANSSPADARPQTTFYPGTSTATEARSLR